MSESGNRKVSGKKGLGKLALFGIGAVVSVTSTRKGSKSWHGATLDWRRITHAEGTYHPEEHSEKARVSDHGTRVRISDLSRKTAIDAASLASSLASLFSYADSALELSVVGSDGSVHPVDQNVQLAGLEKEFEWSVPRDLPVDDDVRETLVSWGVTGLIVSAEKPLKSHIRGVTVYVNGRMANEPEFFDAAASSIAYTYITGYVNADLLDSVTPDVIATDRRAINWENPEAEELADALRATVQAVANERRKLREGKREDATKETVGTDGKAWASSIKGKQSTPVMNMLTTIHSEAVDLPPDTAKQMVSDLNAIAPPYADMFWRTLHPRVQSAIETLYRNEQYLSCVLEAHKTLVLMMREVTEDFDNAETYLFNTYLGDGKKLQLLRNLDASLLTPDSTRAFEDGHRDLSRGLHSAFRNPASHLPVVTLESIGLYSWQDCLDALSALSYTCRRIEHAAKSATANTDTPEVSS